MAITTFRLTSSSTQAAAPFSIGLGFKKGEVPASFVTDLANYQVVVKRRWSDNSVKHAVVSGRAAVSATPLTVTVDLGTPPTGTALSHADIATALQGVTDSFIECGAFGAVNLSALVAAQPFLTWTSGHEMVTCVYRADVGGGTLLSAWFYVTLYAGGKIHIQAVVENGYLDNGAGAVAPDADRDYIPTVNIGGTVVYNNGGVSRTHYRNTRWMAEGWIGGDPAITPLHDVTHLRNTKLVPNFRWKNPSDATLNTLVQSYTPMMAGNIAAGMSAGGNGPHIGLIPMWDALYVTSGDVRAYRATLANSGAINSRPIVHRAKNTNLIPAPSTFPTWTTMGPAQGGVKEDGAGGLQWEYHHPPLESYLAYILTGDYWHYSSLELQASLQFLYLSSGRGTGLNRIFRHDELRGIAWSIRTVGAYVALAPSGDTTAADYRNWLNNGAMKYYRDNGPDLPNTSDLGYPLGIHTYETTKPISQPPWQYHYWVMTNGFLWDIEPGFADTANHLAVRDWMYKAPVGILGGTGGSTDYCFTEATRYYISIGPAIITTGLTTPDQMYKTWGEVFVQQASQDPATDVACGTELKGNSGGHPTAAASGQWGILLGAISYAVDHGAPGAAEAYARLTSASNWGQIANSGFDNFPNWGLEPRSAVAEQPAATVSGKSYRFDTPLVPGKYHFGNRGLGVLGADIPSTGRDGPGPLYNDLDPGDADVELRLVIETQPSAGKLVIEENGALSFTDAPDGSYPWSYRLYAGGSDRGVAQEVLNVGVAVTVSGVTVSPAAPSVAGGATQQFAATVAGTGSPSQAVTWQASAGSINSSGLYTAPAATSSVQTITITATSTQDSSKNGTTTVTVPSLAVPTVSGVTVSPTTVSVAGGGTQQFTASVQGTNSPSQAVTWSVTGGGTINSSGLYTAPATTSSPQNLVVTATSVQDSSKKGSVTVTVPATGSTVSGVTISPTTATVRGGQSQAFATSVQGANTPSQAITWSTSAGSITAQGVFTAPAATSSGQLVTVTATSVQNGSKSATVSITVPAIPTATSPSLFSVDVPTDGHEGALAEFPKQPAEVMDYDVSFVAYLAAISDTVDRVTVDAEDGIALLTHSVSSGVVKVWAGEGTNLTKYKFTIRMTTTGGRVKEVEIFIRVRDT